MAAPNELSFLPDDYLERKGRRRANAVCAALSVVVMGAIASAFWLTERTMSDVEARAAKVDAAFTEAARSIEQVNKMKAQQRKIVHQAELAASLVEKVPRSNILAAFTNALPPGTSLLDLSLESRVKAAPVAPVDPRANKKKNNNNGGKDPNAAPPPPAPVQYDVHIKLTGIADSDVQVAEFMSKLTACPLVKDVNLVITDVFKQSDREMRKFQIEMVQHPQAEVKDEARNTAVTAVDTK
jgi:Tfp pilus assembly protein PilN